MAIELITGRAGKAHIGSEDDRAYHAYTNGEGRYILNGGTANIESANNVHIDPVEFLVDGAHVRVTGAGEDVAIENGVASYKRIDVIALHYTRTGNEDNYIESVEFAVVKGANVELGNTPQAPDMPKSGTILTGADDVYVPVYSLLIDGLTPKNLTTLLEEYALPVANGGTGQTSLQAARNAMGLGNTTGALPVANGGTGASELTANAVLLGNGTSSVKQKATANGAMFATGTGVEPSFGVLPIAQGGTGGTSGTNALNNLGIKKWLLDNVFKVGYVWISYTNTSPSGLVGGTWTPITGRFPYFNAGTSTGGSNTHTLTVAQMPSHNHHLPASLFNVGSGAGSTVLSAIGSGANKYTDVTGGGSAHNNMPAYQTFYAWRRTA